MWSSRHISAPNIKQAYQLKQKKKGPNGLKSFISSFPLLFVFSVDSGSEPQFVMKATDRSLGSCHPWWTREHHLSWRQVVSSVWARTPMKTWKWHWVRSQTCHVVLVQHLPVSMSFFISALSIRRPHDLSNLLEKANETSIVRASHTYSVAWS